VPPEERGGDGISKSQEKRPAGEKRGGRRVGNSSAFDGWRDGKSYENKEKEGSGQRVELQEERKNAYCLLVEGGREI